MIRGPRSSKPSWKSLRRRHRGSLSKKDGSPGRKACEDQNKATGWILAGSSVPGSQQCNCLHWLDPHGDRNWGLNTAIESVNKEATTAMKALEVQIAIADATAPVRRYVHNGDRTAEEQFTERAAVVESQIAEMRTMGLGEEEGSEIEYLAKQWSDQYGDLAAILEISDPVGNPVAVASLDKVEAAASSLRRHSLDVVFASQERLLQTCQEADITSQGANEIVGSTLQWLIVVAVLALVAGLTVGLTVSRSITNAVTALAQAAERISNRELDAAVTLKSKDEMGNLAQSFERMRVSLKTAMDRLQRRQAARLVEKLTANVESKDRRTGFSETVLEILETGAEAPFPSETVI